MSRIDASLDHLVYATPDPAASVEEVRRVTGVRPMAGGRHEGLGTRNHLLGLGGARYLEIIGPDPEQPEPARPRPFGIDALTGPALVTWAVRTGDLDARVARARELGYDPGDAEPMSRSTPEGELLRWRLAFAEKGNGMLPFLIEWGETPHPASRKLLAVTLTSFTGTHPEPASLTPGLQALGVHLDVVPGSTPGLTATLTGPEGDLTI
ncbi:MULTISPECIES: VOC family protein [unclassified Streptomyces]|uniref:VOC family protein n=1 Tax=unclassified Streptomyces TaxID=2593676 RepID=UPI002DD84B3A|nr:MULTISPECIES: VOC family protein [unclassified Streptomyces]WSA91879.1 VOC family protein [Streptomyces sp. NBC_01795]WSB76247.1 VOC family protein [Streptomyces sp. NBC_01775]WSS15478.1 VOC family protein [Streptomyces sp. NBC_01186]WSS44320.1 VOC family protein [Streptomyces sp. NBC_01187]